MSSKFYGAVSHSNVAPQRKQATTTTTKSNKSRVHHWNKLHCNKFKRDFTDWAPRSLERWMPSKERRIWRRAFPFSRMRGIKTSYENEWCSLRRSSIFYLLIGYGTFIQFNIIHLFNFKSRVDHHLDTTCLEKCWKYTVVVLFRLSV